MSDHLPAPSGLGGKLAAWAAVVAVGLTIAGGIYTTATTLSTLSEKSDRNCRLEVALDRDVRILVLLQAHDRDQRPNARLLEEALRALPSESC